MASKHGQAETLPGIEVPTPVSELSERRALVTVTRPQYWGMEPADYLDITDTMRERAKPDQFLESLTRPSDRDEAYGVNYELDDGLIRYVALSPAEYKIINHSFDPRHLGRTVTAATRSGKYTMLPTDTLSEVSHSKKITAISKKHNAMAAYVNRVLIPEEVRLSGLQEAALRYWRGRGRADSLRLRISEVLTRTMPNTLEVVGLQRGWDSEKAALAKRSLEDRLFFTVPDRERMNEWYGLFSMLAAYNSYKEFAFRERMGRFQGYLRTVAPEIKLDQTS